LIKIKFQKRSRVAAGKVAKQNLVGNMRWDRLEGFSKKKIFFLKLVFFFLSKLNARTGVVRFGREEGK
jgi:hypothetical protein